MSEKDITQIKYELRIHLIEEHYNKKDREKGHLYIKMKRFEILARETEIKLPSDTSNTLDKDFVIDSYYYDKANDRHYFLYYIKGGVTRMRFYGGYYTLDKKKNRINDLKIKLLGWGNKNCELDDARRVFLDMIQGKELTPVKSNRKSTLNDYYGDYTVFIVDTTMIVKSFLDAQ